MSLRASERRPSAPLLQTAASASGTTRPLYSDAIRLRKGVTITGVTTAPTFVNAGRRSFQEPFVPRRAPSTHAPNGGLNIDALVASAQTSLCIGHDEMEVALKMGEIKQWFKKKGKQAKDKVKKLMGKKGEDEASKKAKEAAARKQMMDAGIMPRPTEDSDDECADGGTPPCTDPNRTSAGFDEVHAMVQQHALEVHGIDLATASASTRLLHTRAAEVLTGMQLRADDDFDTESVMKKAKEAKAWMKAKAKAAKDKVKKMMRKKKDGDESSSEDEDWERPLSLNEARDAMAAAKKKKTGMAFDEVLHEARTMVQQHALEVNGIDLDVADKDTRALHAHMAEAIAHMHVATNGAAWEDDLDVGAPEWWGRHTGWAHEAETGAPAWWERKKDQAKAAMAKAKDAMGKASAKAKEVKNKVANSAVGQMASKAKEATSKFAKEKYARFTNENRITKMERYDYGLYISQNPLTNITIDKKKVSLPVGHEEGSTFNDPRTHDAETTEAFYGLLATKHKNVMPDKFGSLADGLTFDMKAEDTMKVLSVEKNRELFVVPQPDAQIDLLARIDIHQYEGHTNFGDGHVLLKRAIAQGDAQMHATAANKNRPGVFTYPNGKKLNGAHPLCLGHSMMKPIADMAANSLASAAVPMAFLQKVEKELVASEHRGAEEFTTMLREREGEPFVVAVPSKYHKDSDAYAEAFGGNLNTKDLKPVSALLVVPLTAEFVEKNIGAFKHSEDQNFRSIQFAYEKRYPWETLGNRPERKKYADPGADVRAEYNAILEEIKGDIQPKDRETYDEAAARTLEEHCNKIGKEMYSSVTGMEKPITWELTEQQFTKDFQVAVFALGLSDGCDPAEETMVCKRAFGEIGTGKVLMIGEHPLLFGDRLSETGAWGGFENPGAAYVSMGKNMPLLNAVSEALNGVHIDLRFLWASMKLAQRCWSMATNARVSKASQSRFRYLIKKPIYRDADQKFDFLGDRPTLKERARELKDGAKALFKKDQVGIDESALGKAFETLGLVRVTTGQQLKLDEITPEEFEKALQLAGIDLDSDED